MRIALIGSLGCWLSGWWRHWRKARRPSAATPVEFLHCGHTERHGIVAEHAVERPPLAVLSNERHRVVLRVGFRLGLRKDFDRIIAHQASVELVLRVEVRHAAHDGMFRPGQFYVEGAIGVMLMHGWSRSGPCASGKLGELRPLVEPRAARKVRQRQSFAPYHELPKVLPGMFTGSGLLPVLKVQQDDIVFVYSRGVQERGVFHGEHL